MPDGSNENVTGGSPPIEMGSGGILDEVWNLGQTLSIAGVAGGGGPNTALNNLIASNMSAGAAVSSGPSR